MYIFISLFQLLFFLLSHLTILPFRSHLFPTQHNITPLLSHSLISPPTRPSVFSSRLLLLILLSLSCLFLFFPCSRFPVQSPEEQEVEESGTLDQSVGRAGGMGEGTVLTPLQPMSPQRQALLNSRCYQMSPDCWDLPVDYTKIKSLDEDHKEVQFPDPTWEQCCFIGVYTDG